MINIQTKRTLTTGLMQVSMQTSTTVMSIDKQRGMIMTGIERFMVRVMELEERIKELESQVAALQNNS